MSNALNQLKAMNKKDNYAIGSVSNSGSGGSGGGAVFVDVSNSTATKTSGEIFQSIMDGNTVVFREQSREGNDKFHLWTCLSADNVYEYNFYVIENEEISYFTSDTASDYPRLNGK